MNIKTKGKVILYLNVFSGILWRTQENRFSLDGRLWHPQHHQTVCNDTYYCYYHLHHLGLCTHNHLMSNFVQVKMATGLPGVPLVLVIRPVGEVLEWEKEHAPTHLHLGTVKIVQEAVQKMSRATHKHVCSCSKAFVHLRHVEVQINVYRKRSENSNIG